MSNKGTEPIFYVLVQPEGKSERDRIDVTDQILSLEYEDDEKKADILKLEVDNWDLANFDDPVWRPGGKLIATWGYPGRLAPQRECIIQKVEGSTKITVTAQSKAVLMNKETKARSWQNTTRSDVVRGIAYAYGYSFENQDIEDTAELYETISQARMTDAQFVKKLADAEHFEFYVDFDGFHWHARRTGQKPLRVLQFYLPPDVGDILDFTVENDIFAKPGKVTTKGRDPLKKKDVTGEGSNASTERIALNPITEIIDPATGITTLQTQAASSDTKPTTETSSAQAKKEADGAFKRSVQTTVKLSLDLVGDPGTFAKCVLDIRGISKRLSGLYYVNRATHRIDSSGYKLKVLCATDGTHGHSENLVAGATPTPASLQACKAEAAAKTRALEQTTIKSEIDRLQAELKAINARCKAIEASISKAKANDGAGKTKDPDASTMTETLNPDGTTEIHYSPDGKER